MKKTNLLGLLLVSCLAVFMSACASVPMSSVEEDAQAKKFAVPADKGRIYVYRNETLGAAIKVTVALDGKAMGQTAKEVYFAWDVAPGAHEVNCFAESSSAVDVHVKKGQAVYIWQEMKMGLMSAGCALHEMPESAGQNGVLECKRAAN